MPLLQWTTRSSAIAEIARVTIRSVIAVDQLAVTVTINMTCQFYFTKTVVNRLSSVPPLCQLTRCSIISKANSTNNV